MYLVIICTTVSGYYLGVKIIGNGMKLFYNNITIRFFILR